MCLLVIAHDHHKHFRFVFAGNRDEFHARPAQPAAWWTDAPALLAGRDLEAGGTWLGITRDGRFAAVTNYREAHADLEHADKLSRGAIVRDFLQSGVSAQAFASDLHANGDRYRGFCLIAGDGDTLWFVSNRDPQPRALDRGVYGLSNELLDVPWPKVVQAKSQLMRILGREPSTQSLLEMLGPRMLLSAAETHAATPSIERVAESIFVSSPNYGTRCSTAITITHRGEVAFAERSYDERGTPIGEQRFAFRIDSPEPIQ